LKHFYATICRVLLPIGFFFLHAPLTAQVRITGTVYNMTRNFVLPDVSVLSTSGIGTVTDSTGSYSIIVYETDSIWFSYLNKPTPKFAVRDISKQNNFDIALHVPVTELKEVRVIPRNYKLDSLQNRLDYAKAFNFRKPGISLSAPANSSFGVGIDLDELINIFNFKKNRRMLAFQRRLIQEEEDKYIDHRFTKPLVRKITGLTGVGPVLDDFMKKYRPSYEFATIASDYEFAEYIQLAWVQYKTRM
jgi:hypothetical protein